MTIYHWCEIQRKVVEGPPPKKYRTYAKAPMIVLDSMPPQYHEAAKRVIDTRSEWRRSDKEHGTITFSPNEDTTPKDDIEYEKQKRRSDIKEARRRAVADVRANRAPLTDDQKALCRQQDERISQQLGYDVRKIWSPKKIRGSKAKRNKSVTPK